LFDAELELQKQAASWTRDKQSNVFVTFVQLRRLVTRQKIKRKRRISPQRVKCGLEKCRDCRVRGS